MQLNQAQDFAATERKSPPSSLPAPRGRVRQTEGRQAIEPAPDTERSGVGFREAFLNALGQHELVAQALYEQLLDALTPPLASRSTTPARTRLALIRALSPEDSSRRCCLSDDRRHIRQSTRAVAHFHVEQTAGGRAAYLGLARKLMTLFPRRWACSTATAARERPKRSLSNGYSGFRRQAIVGAVSNGDGNEGRLRIRRRPFRLGGRNWS